MTLRAMVRRAMTLRAMIRRLRRLAVALAAVSAVVSAALAAEAQPPSAATPEGAAVLTPGPFALRRLDGGVLDGTELDGQSYGLFFGFTHCPDVCPTTLADVTLALQALGAAARDFRVYFVAVDPERDSPEALATLLSSFDPRIVGLRGSADDIAAATRAFGAVARKRAYPNGDYAMEHTAALFLVDSNGVIVDRVGFAERPQAIARRIAAAAGR